MSLVIYVSVCLLAAFFMIAYFVEKRKCKRAQIVAVLFTVTVLKMRRDNPQFVEKYLDKEILDELKSLSKECFENDCESFPQ